MQVTNLSRHTTADPVHPQRGEHRSTPTVAGSRAKEELRAPQRLGVWLVTPNGEGVVFHGAVSKEIAKSLQVLKKRIAAARIPPSKLDESVNIATWNIREFRRKRRSEAAIH